MKCEYENENGNCTLNECMYHDFDDSPHRDNYPICYKTDDKLPGDYMDEMIKKKVSKEDVLAGYYSLKLSDKMLLTSLILYDLDVGDYSAEDREKDWDECFGNMINHIEKYLSYIMLDDIQHKFEKDARYILEEQTNCVE